MPLGAFQQHQRKREENRHTRRLQMPQPKDGVGPAALVIPPRLQAQVAGLTRIIVDGESGISLVQTAEAALHELLRLLEQLQEIASYAAQGLEQNPKLREADQRELENLLQNIDHIAEVTSYGPERLLDGSHEVHGVAQGEYLEFVSATAETQTAPVSGYSILITQAPAPSTLRGLRPLTTELLQAGEQLWFREKQRQFRFRAHHSESHTQFLDRLNRSLQGAGLPLEVRQTSDWFLEVEHQYWGSAPSFEVASSTPGVLGSLRGTIRKSERGIDVEGQIDGHEAIGKGAFLYMPPGTGRTAGLCVRVNGKAGQLQLPLQGTVSLFQNALRFGSQPGSLRLNMRSVCSADLGRHVPNRSGFENLSDLNVLTEQGGQDAQLLIERAQQEVQQQLEEIQSFRTGRLQQQLVQLRKEHNQLLPADQLLANDEQATTVAAVTSQRMKEDQLSGLQAQVCHTPHSLQSLLD